MGFQDDKGKIFEEIGVFKVMEGLPKEKKPSSFDSVKSKSKNLLPFMLDLLSSSCTDNAKTLKDKARCSGSRILKDVLIEFLPELARISKEGVVKAIKAGLACGTDFSIPSSLPGTSNGTPEFTDKIDKVDFTDLMKVDPTSPTGNLLFGKNNKDFNRRLVETIQSAPTSTGGIKSDKWTTQGGVDLLDIKFDSNTEDLTIGISSNWGGKSFQDFLVTYVNSVEMFPKKTAIATLTDQMFGTISASLDISSEKLLALEQMDRSVDKILETDVCTDDLIIDDSFFSFDNEDRELMERNARNKSRGVNVVDLGCGFVEVSVPVDVLSGLTTVDTLSPKKSGEVLEKTLDDLGNTVGGFGGDNSETMKKGFNLNGIKAIPKTMVRMIITPKVTTLYQISNKTINGVVLNVTNGYDFSKAAKTFFDYVVREAGAALLKILFNKIKKELLILIQKVVMKIIKEKIQLFLGAIAGIYLSKTDKDPSKALDVIGAASDGVDSFNPDVGSLV